jgi:hypothetical protein
MLIKNSLRRESFTPTQLRDDVRATASAIRRIKQAHAELRFPDDTPIDRAISDGQKEADAPTSLIRFESTQHQLKAGAGRISACYQPQEGVRAIRLVQEWD